MTLSVVETLSSGKGEAFEASPLLPAFDPALLRRHAPDEHQVCVEGDRTVARCSLWWRRVPGLSGERLGAIGHFAATDEACGTRLLEEACRTLRARGCTLAVGPMDGNTWRRYRLITERGPEPAFLLEPDNPDEWPAYFRASGFQTLASYRSSVNDDLSHGDPRLDEVDARLARRGVRIRPVDAARFDEELRLAYAVSLESFRNNFLYTPLEESEFLEQNRPLQALIRPGLAWMALKGDDPVGFLFGLPDLARPERREPVTTYIVKTVAVLPRREYAGLGTLLMARTRLAARALGFGRAIHALMHEGNFSTNFSAGHVRTIRRYELFARNLAPPA